MNITDEQTKWQVEIGRFLVNFARFKHFFSHSLGDGFLLTVHIDAPVDCKNTIDVVVCPYYRRLTILDSSFEIKQLQLTGDDKVLVQRNVTEELTEHGPIQTTRGWRLVYADLTKIMKQVNDRIEAMGTA